MITAEEVRRITKAAKEEQTKKVQEEAENWVENEGVNLIVNAANKGENCVLFNFEHKPNEKVLFYIKEILNKNGFRFAETSLQNFTHGIGW